MSFTAITITGTFENPDGSVASGTFCAKPSAVLSNGSVEQSAAPICGVLNDAGQLVAQSGQPFVVNATNDSGTTPEGEYYTFTLQLDGQALIEFAAPLLTGGGNTITFAALRALSL